MPRFCFALFFASAVASFAFAGDATALPPELSIRYHLKEPGKTSVAVYDAAGRMVRTLRSAKLQSAGDHTLLWDGLDQQGNAVPIGQYTWRLASGPGVRAEYVMTLGTSAGINHWPGQHGGPSMVARDGDAIIVGGNPEGSPALVKTSLAGTYHWAAPNIEASDVVDMAADNGRLYFLQGSSNLYTLSSTDGKRVQQHQSKDLVPAFSMLLPLGKLEGTGSTDGTTYTIEARVPKPDGEYLIRLHPAQKGRPPALSANVQGWQTGFYRTGPEEYLIPEVYRWPAPKKCKATDGKLVIKLQCETQPPPPEARGAGSEDKLDSLTDPVAAVPAMELVAPARRIDVRDGVVVALFEVVETVAWFNPVDRSIVHKVAVPGAHDLAVGERGEVVVAAGTRLVRITKEGSTAETVVSDLSNAERISIDRTTGEIWVFDGGSCQQVKRFGPDYKFRAAYGRLGGRKAGLYQPQDFLAVTDLTGDGSGGFVVVESNSAPRRTAHFDADGKLQREWYGGQQFYTFAAPEPGDPTRVWMDSQWNWLIQADVDYANKTWKVRACYEWNRDLDPHLFPTGKMAGRMYPIRRPGPDGQPVTHLWLQNAGLLLRVDEAAGRLVPVAHLGRMFPNTFWNWNQVPKQRYPQGYRDALAALGKDYREYSDVKMRLAFGWADRDGDGLVQGEELHLREPQPTDGHGFNGGPPCLWIDPQMRRYESAPSSGQPSFRVRAPLGQTKVGAPTWQWESPTEPGPVLSFTGSRALRPDAAGNIFQVLSGGGDGYASGLDGFHSHGANWPGTLVDRTAVVKVSPQGKILWQVGPHAARWNHEPGQIHHPTCVAGFAHGCVGVCDYFVHPCHFWTDDGLYVGALLDSRTDDGLPERVYSWWRADRAKGDTFDNLALFQYDMLVGGSLVELASGEAIFLGAGWNNVPVFRVHGLKPHHRAAGTVEVTSETITAEGTGTGLAAEYYWNAEPTGNAVARGAAGPIWFQATPPKQTVGRTWEPVPGATGDVSARWTGKLEPRFSEDYTFALYLRGKARLYIDGELIIDHWEQPANNEKLFSDPIPLRAGRKVAIALEYAKAGVDQPEVHLCWESLTQQIEHVPSAALYAPTPEASE